MLWEVKLFAFVLKYKATEHRGFVQLARQFCMVVHPVASRSRGLHISQPTDVVVSLISKISVY